MSWWGTIAKLAGKGALAIGTGGASLAAPGVGVGSMIGDVGDALGAAGQANATNQGNQISAAERQALLANQTSQANDQARGNAWKDLLHADYVMNNNNGYTPTTIKSNVPGVGDHQLPSFGIARQPFTSQAVLGAAGMANEAEGRLRNGPQLHTPDLMGMSHPSTWQKILNVAAPAAKMGGNMMAGKYGSFGMKPPIAMDNNEMEP